jgi:FolB domain-containing protein
MDRLILKGIKARTVIGIHAEEKLAEQGIAVSVILHGDFQNVIENDELSGGFDYVDVVDTVRSFCRHHRCNTLEHLAHHLALHIKETFSAEKIELTVDKPRYTGKLEMEAIRFHVER